MSVVDTDVLVYASDEDSPHHRRCRDKLNRRCRQSAA
jgi:predicted nucleic acid-binding protein